MAVIEYNGFEIEVGTPVFERLAQQDAEFAKLVESGAPAADTPKPKRTKKAAPAADEGETLE